MLSFISDLLPTVYAEEKKHQGPTTAAKEEEKQPTPEEVEEARIIWAACEETSACAPLKHHLNECAKRVENGTFKEGDCIEELQSMLRCVFECSVAQYIQKHENA